MKCANIHFSLKKHYYTYYNKKSEEIKTNNSGSLKHFNTGTNKKTTTKKSDERKEISIVPKLNSERLSVSWCVENRAELNCIWNCKFSGIRRTSAKKFNDACANVN